MSKPHTVQMLRIKFFLLPLIFLAAIATLAFFSTKPVRASHGGQVPTSCRIESIEVGGESYSPSDPIPEFRRFSLELRCNASFEQGIAVQLFVNVDSAGELSGTLSSIEGTATSQVTVGDFSGLTGGPGPTFPSYGVELRYQFGGGHTEGGDSLCSLADSSAPCRIRVEGTGEPPPGPFDAACPQFKQYNPSTPKPGEPVQIQFTPPSPPNPDASYIFEYGNGSTQAAIDKSTEATFGVWVVNITVDEETPWRISQSVLHGPSLCDEGIITFEGPSGLSTSWWVRTPWSGDTALGKIPWDPGGFTSAFLSIGLGIAGGVAFLLMVFGSYRLIFSAGNPEAIQQGREIITAAIAGLLLIVFSVFILRLIGISILRIPI